jgi:hypothetical protein
MLKSFSAQTNALGALNYKGTWDATANSPALASSVGTKGDYYVVSVAGSTALNGISNWGVGDWAVFNGSVWQRVEGGADVNAVDLTVSGNTTLSGPVSVTPTWNAGGTTFTGIGLNVTDTASAAGSLLLDLQVGGVSQFKISKAGTGTFTGNLITSQSVFGTSVYLGTGALARLASTSDGIITLFDSNGTSFGRLRLGGTTNSFGAIARDGAGISIVGGAGGSTAHIKVPGVTVANLPAAATAGAGARSFVTDALAPVFGSAVAGSGAVNVPVYSDGAAWNVG